MPEWSCPIRSRREYSGKRIPRYRCALMVRVRIVPSTVVMRRLHSLALNECYGDLSTTSDRIFEMKTVFLIFLLAIGHFEDAQDSKEPQALAGCYELKVKGWHPFTSLDLLPTRFQLTTRAANHGFLVRNIDARVREELPLSFWNVKGDGKIEIVWSTGFVGWKIRLNGDLRGMAGFFTDTPPQPSGDVAVVIHAVDCKGWEGFSSDQH
jgi:hypothetical protein